MSRTQANIWDFLTWSPKWAPEIYCEGNSLKTKGFLVYESCGLLRDKGFVSFDKKAWREEHRKCKISPNPGEDTEYNTKAAFQLVAKKERFDKQEVLEAMRLERSSGKLPETAPRQSASFQN